MPAFTVSRTINIKASAEKIFEILSNYDHWTVWSPWLIQEPEAKVTVREDGKYYEWTGNRVGAGSMTLTKALPNEVIEMDLLFLKPWKSQSKISFKLRSHSDYTEVIWQMDGNLPFFMFWMVKKMDVWLGMDFERGLLMLKEYVELGAPQTQMNFKGKSNYTGGVYIGVEMACSKKQLADQMKKAFGDMHAFFESHQDLINGDPFTNYSKWDPVKDKIVCVSAFPVKSVPSDLPNHLVAGELPSASIYSIEHKGPYHHMGNPWSTLHSMQRNKEFKMNKKMSPFEVYRNNPMEVDASELVTEVCFPLK